MAKLTSVPVENLEPGMKLGAAVTSPSGQSILTAGMVLEETHIQFLKRRGIRSVQIAELDYTPADSTAYEQTLEKIGSKAAPAAGPDDVDVSTIDPAGPGVVLDRMPAEIAPKDAPTPEDVKTEAIEKAGQEWKSKRADRKIQMEKKHGEKYKKVVRALGEPRPLGPAQSFKPAMLFSDAAKDMTEQLYLEKKLNEDTLGMLTKNITMEIVSRQGMATLLARAQAAGQYLLAHMVNVGVYSMYLAIQMELSSQEIQDTSIGGMLADIGMLALPEEYWTLNRELERTERTQLVRHPEESRKMIMEAPGAQELWGKIAVQHHERLDGSGYPKQLKAPEIDIYSRIVQICDVYSASTADRAYRDAHFPDDALRHMMGKPHLYDRSILEIFCQLVGFFPEGYIVLLSSGEHAVVVTTNAKNVFRPIVRLRKDKNGRPYMPHEQVILDLSTRLDLRIVKILEDDSIRWA